MKKLLLISSSIAILALSSYSIYAVNTYLSNGKDFHDCVINKMRGMDKSLMSHASGYCESIHKKIVNIDNLDVDMIWTGNYGEVSITVKPKEPGLKIHSVSTLFTPKDCDKLPSNLRDYEGDFLDFYFDGSATATVHTSTDYKCFIKRKSLIKGYYQ